MGGKKIIFIEDENDKENTDGIKEHLEAIGEVKKKKSRYAVISVYLIITILRYRTICEEC